MPVTVTYPGVYLEEIQNTVHTVTAATTSDTAFIDQFIKGPVNTAQEITSLNQFSRIYGGLDPNSAASYGIQQFFLNGGGTAWVVRVAPKNAVASSAALAATSSADAQAASSTPAATGLTVAANSVGNWGDALGYSFTDDGKGTYTLQVLSRPSSPSGSPSVLESYYQLSTDSSSPSYVPKVVNPASQYVVVTASSSPSAPASAAAAAAGPTYLAGGSDGTWATGEFNEALITQVTKGTAALDRIAPAVFNILCIPASSYLSSGDLTALLPAAIKYCTDNQAFMIVDPPPPTDAATQMPNIADNPTFVDTTEQMLTWADSTQNLINDEDYAAALYWPYLTMPDPLNNFNPLYVPPSGTLAGIYAATDAARGVWTAPAGVDAVIQGATLAQKLTDDDSGQLNPEGINALRSFPIYGQLVWGARTLAGADLLDNVFKYVPVRRLTDFVEQSLVQSLKWAVFEPNGPALWSSITIEVTSFLQGLWGEGAFTGTTQAQAFFVQCDSSTTTEDDIQNGICNVVIGISPVSPAEFIVLQVQVPVAQGTGS